MPEPTISDILFVTSHNPWGIGGGCLATRLYLNAIRELYPTVHIDLCIHSDFSGSIPPAIANDSATTIHLSKQRPLSERLKSLLNGQMHRHQAIASKLLAEKRYNFCFFDKSHIAGTLCRVAKRNGQTGIVTLHHNYEPDYFRYENVGAVLRMAFARHVRRLEKISFLESDLNLFLSDDDRIQFESSYGRSNARHFVTGVFEETPSAPPSHDAQPNTLIITGSLNNRQNLDGIKHFISHLYPLLPTDFHVTIAGQSPLPEIVSLCAGKENVTLVSSPSDIGALVNEAAVFLCPTKVGSGIKIRITDGLKKGLPVIAHRVSARGYGAMIEAGVMKCYSTPGEFLNALHSMWEEMLQGKLTRRGVFEAYASVFGREKGVQRLGEALKPLLTEQQNLTKS